MYCDVVGCDVVVMCEYVGVCAIAGGQVKSVSRNEVELCFLPFRSKVHRSDMYMSISVYNVCVCVCVCVLRAYLS